MRVFTFFLMVMVAIGGGLTGYRVVTGKDLVKLSDLGIATTTPAPVSKATPQSSPTATPRPSPTPEPTPVPPTPTPVPDSPQVMMVGNTDGQGVFLRRSPNPDDKVRAWVEGSKMEIVGPDVEVAGKTWKKVRAPNGQEGYIPQEFLVEAR